VLLAPTASIARHDDPRTAPNPACCFNVALSPDLVLARLQI
jgi:hypothetical protein